MRYVLALLVCLLPGCIPPKDVSMPGPDGKLYILIRCLHSEECLYRAAKYCPRGYTDRHEGQIRNMMIRCTDADASASE